MAKVESFSLDHDAVKAPYVRIAGAEEGPNGDRITKFDLRFVQPNQAAIPTSALHTMEHLIAAYIRDYMDNVIDVSPMGCRTGFYMICWGERTVAEAADAITKTLEDIMKSTWDDVQGTERQQCGNYRDHSLWGAQAYAQEILAQGFSLDAFERQFS
ncbi:S-ribosylhomocysteine lyase [Aerococcus kribbianus]|uniref:S-ribosylhomocysteine lyase n=1 Tax=Aerococcus kribbianus TaxID=2999064 RepID=A0A9X3FMZ9_9LACT|nr:MULTISPECIES: S-ribosylhomocysteine lyase [unclassified Aerococcus]MCZ0717465.1 S-ribosylhomocysteine lyase [Aerococcus sp. YH-aer221]MCZ0725753.1 S-ribosylhomocysteine lyase [Aerococcus sp. YH-aer222]